MALVHDIELRLLLLREALRANLLPSKRRARRRGTFDYLRHIPEEQAHGIGIATIIKDEAPYLAEWTEFHLMIGVRHIHFYDNGSSDNTLEILAPYLRDQLVSVLPWRNFAAPAQPLAFAHAMANYGGYYRWMAFTDVDEFLFPVEGESLEATMKKLEHLPAISLPWIMFGPSGHQARPEGLVIKNFTERAAFPPIASQYSLLKHKSIVNPRKVARDLGIHLFNTKEQGAVLINDRGQVYPHHQLRVLEYATADHLRLHHYFTRSLDELRAKLTKGRVDKWGAVDMKVLDRRLEHYSRHTEQDTTIQRFIPELERRLAVRFGTSYAARTAPAAAE
jgi:hypothetical protein